MHEYPDIHAFLLLIEANQLQFISWNNIQPFIVIEKIRKFNPGKRQCFALCSQKTSKI